MISSCDNCCGNDRCKCCQTGNELTISEKEYKILIKFAELPFMPAVFSYDDPQPFSDDFVDISDDYGDLLLELQSKGLISIDSDVPLTGFDYSSYKNFPLHPYAFANPILSELYVVCHKSV